MPSGCDHVRDARRPVGHAGPSCARCETWEEFAACAVALIPVMVEQLQAVTAQTEVASLELGAALKRLAQGGPGEPSVEVTRIVMSMQFQDITRQAIEHVIAPLRNMQAHMAALREGEAGGHDAETAGAALQALHEVRQRYARDGDRAILREAPGREEPGHRPAVAGDGDDNVTLF